LEKFILKFLHIAPVGVSIFIAHESIILNRKEKLAA